MPIVRLYLSLPFPSTSTISPAIKFAKNCFDFLPYGCLSSGASMPNSLTLICCLFCNIVTVSPSWIETTLFCSAISETGSVDINSRRIASCFMFIWVAKIPSEGSKQNNKRHNDIK